FPIDSAVDSGVDAGVDLRVDSGVDTGVDATVAVDPPSFNNCTEINQFANTTTNWGISQVAFSPDGRYLATGDQSGQTKSWTMTRGTPLSEGQILTSGNGGNMQPAFSPDGRLLAAGSTHGDLALWNVSDWTKRGDLVAAAPALGDVRGAFFT